MHTVIESTDSAFHQYWSRLYANDPLQNPLYGQQGSDRAESGNNAPQFTDRSFLVISGNEPVFGCSLTLHTDADGRKRMGYFGLEASTHVNRKSLQQTSNSFRPEAIDLLQQHIRGLIDEVKPDSLDYLDPVSCGMMSPVTQVLLEIGAKPTIYKAQLINLALSERSLLRLVSKTYRSLINWGQQNLEFSIIVGSTDGAEEISLAELFNSGNQPLASIGSDFWSACQDILKEGNGFLVQARHNETLVANAMFVYNDMTCHYVAGEVLSNAPSRPILQSVIWEAIMHSKKLGCAQFELACALTKEATQEFDILPERFGGESQTRLKISLVQ